MTMSKYVVLRLKGKQYKVSEGETFLVDKMIDTKAEPEILLTVDGSKVAIGDPTVKDAKVKLTITEQEVKGEKIDIFKYKSKSRYRKHLGFRPKYTKLLLDKIA